jgi:hypothetical protein
LELYTKIANKIEKKVLAMRKYEEFLERVKEKNPDEFNDLSDINSRYTLLNAKQIELLTK